MGAGSITLFHVRGIRIAVDWSWFIVLFLVIFFLSDFYADLLGESGGSTDAYLLAVVTALGFFGSILLHELGHAFVALRRGIGIASIQLWIFGGMARMERDSDSPATEFKVAIAGPLVTLALALALGAIGTLAAGWTDFSEAMVGDTDTPVSGVLAMVAWLATINALVLVFNLLPAFPMDGGRIARAIAWRITGNRNSATRFAATLGRGFAYLFIGAGILLVINDAVFSGIWLVFIGILINSSARGAALQTSISSRIEGMRVADVMDTEPVAIPEELTVEQALDEYFLRYRWPWFPVVDTAGRFKGLLVRDRADEVPEVSRAGTTVGDLVEPDPGSLHVLEDSPLDALLGNEALSRLGALIAVDADGRLRGVITAEQVGRALRGGATGSLG
ncbi:MAG: site-2 protease family protein [Solirubrobacterales bacterium]